MTASKGCTIFVLVYCISTINCFNIDTENVLIFQGKNRNSYFGYSSALTKIGNNLWLLVGAPRDNSSAEPYIPRPGNLYRCVVNLSGNKTRLCNDVYKAIKKEKQGTVYQQENQLFGTNVYVIGKQDRYVACAPQVKRLRDISTNGQIYTVGSCSIGDVSNTDAKPQSTIIRELPMVGKQKWRWGSAMMGFSFTPIDISRFFVIDGVLWNWRFEHQYQWHPTFDGVMGGPGFYEGKGCFVLINTNTTEYKIYTIMEKSDLDKAIKHGSYLGYELTTGTFGAYKSLLVASAPHFYNDEGHVGIVLLLLLNRNMYTESKKIFTGTQPGAGFGSSLLVSDINGDGLDDLLVGSPYFTGKNTDEGLVNVYYGTGNSELLRPTRLELCGLCKRLARFGTTISGLGDVNDDHYNDIAIGAPYEDDQRGAVYIYNGNDGDLNTQHSQRIAASELDSGLRAFGFHVSKAFDIDSNAYNDISVGAYMSDQTVVLRSRPIVRLKSIMTLSPPVIRLNSSGLECQTTADDLVPCVIVNVCFNFSGRGVDKRITVRFTLKADTGRTKHGKTSRVLLQKSDGSFGDQMTEKVILNKLEINCKKIKARVPSTNREFYQVIETPVVFQANYSLSPERVAGQVLPILDKNSIQFVQQQGNISIGCKGGICQSDLKMKEQFSVNSVIVGDTKEISVSIQLHNLGNPAYGALVIISSSNAVYTDTNLVDQRSVLVVCNSTLPRTLLYTDVVCDFEKPFFKHHYAAFVSKFNISMEQLLPPGTGLDELEKSVIFDIETQVATPSTEIDDSNNKISKKIPVMLASEIEITRISVPDQVKISDEANGVISFTHTYELYNKGPSPLPPTLFHIDVPVQGRQSSKENIQMVNEHYIRVPEIWFMSTRIEPANKCRFIGNNDPASLKHRNQTLNSKEEIKAPDLLKKPIRTPKNITCSNSKCAHIECQIDLLEKDGFFTVSIHQTLEESLMVVEQEVPWIQYFTNVTLRPPQHQQFMKWTTNKSRSVKIDIYPATPQRTTTKKIEIWIIIVGSIGGIILFVIVGIILWKCGFFKRTKRDRVEEWKRKSGYKERRSHRATIHRQDGRVNSFIAPTTSTNLEWMKEKTS